MFLNQGKVEVLFVCFVLFSHLDPNFLGQQTIKAAHLSLCFSRRNLESKDLSTCGYLERDYRVTQIGDGEGGRGGKEAEEGWFIMPVRCYSGQQERGLSC